MSKDYGRLLWWMMFFKVIMFIASCMVDVAKTLAKTGLRMSEWVMKHPKLLRFKEIIGKS